MEPADNLFAEMMNVLKDRLGDRMADYAFPPPNVTRRLEVTYSHPATVDMGTIVVHARLLERQDRLLSFRADVRDPEGRRLARAKAVHWILDDKEAVRGQGTL
jgi:acyl-CoA thioesterase FadM